MDGRTDRQMDRGIISISAFVFQAAARPQGILVGLENRGPILETDPQPLACNSASDALAAVCRGVQLQSST